MNVYRYEVPDDGKWHAYTLSGPIVKVAARELSGYRNLHFWALEGAGTPFTAMLRIYGTGEEVPDETVYRGTAIAEPLVWHLFEQA